VSPVSDITSSIETLKRRHCPVMRLPQNKDLSAFISLGALL
jgi:hypothetical protein